MNPGETLPRGESEDAELGEALHHRLSQLAARLERLTGGRDGQRHPAAEPAVSARALDVFAMEAERGRPNGPPRPRDPVAPPRRDTASLAEIAAALRDLDRQAPPRPTPVEAPPADTIDHRAAEGRLRAIRQRIDALKARHGGAEPVSPAPSPPAPAAAPARTAARPAPAQPLPAPQPEAVRQRRTADFNAAIAEITARQRVIDEAPSPRQEPPAPPSAPAQPRPDPAMAGALAELQRRVAELSRLTEPAPAAPPSPSLKGTEPGEDRAVAGLTRQLDDLRAQLRAVPERRDEVIESGQAVIIDRLDKLLARESDRNIDEIAQEILHRVPSSERFDALAAEIDRLSERIATVDHRPELLRLDERISSFERQLTARAEEPAPGARLEAEMGAIRDAVENLSRMLHNNGSPALQRLEARLNQVSERFETALASAPKANVVSDLLQRLETIAARGETAPAALEALAAEIAELRARERSELASLDTHIQALAQRLDESIAGQNRGGTAFADLEQRIGSLARRLDDLAAADPSADRLAELAQVEDQITQLSARVDQIDAAEQSPDALGHLESQIGALQSRLELLSTDHETLHRVQDNLSRLEALVFDTEIQSLDSVQQAARDAVHELSGLNGSQDSAMVEALKADLRQLQDAARSSDRQTADTLDTVHQTLDRVVARLNSLEHEVRSQPAAAPAAAPRAAEAKPAAEPASRQALAGSRPAARSEEPAADDKPLVPGSPRPQPATGDRDRRADFIAAARRAAQAAAAEHSAMRRVAAVEDTDETTPAAAGPFARLRRLVSDHRRPILIAAGAIVLAIAVIQIVRPFDRSPEPQEPAPIVEPAEPAAAAPAPVTPAATAPAPVSAVAPPVADPPTASPGPAAFIPPAGVTSPQVGTPAPAVEAPALEAPAATLYPMPEEAVGSPRLRIAAAAGDPAALYEVGARYAEGREVDRNLAEAAVWLERAAEAGLAVAQHRLASLYEAGLGVAENRPAAYTWYLAAAEQGNVLAMHNLGVMLSQGVEGTPDFPAAVEWFTAAADHGIRDSQYNLGVIYARGIGVEPDLIASYKWFALAAAQGDSDAAARRDDVAAALSPEELANARAAVSAWAIEGAPAAANTVAAPEGGWDAPEERVEALDHDDLVRTIQTLLAERGFDPGPADGVEGPQTRDAVRAFQEAVGLPATGLIDETLLEVLANRAA